MARRADLHRILCDILGSDHVYYQPPPSCRLAYPAIVYKREDIQNSFADDEVYMQSHVYTVTVIDADPDSVFVEEISKLPTCRFDRHYAADNLNHDVFLIHY